MKSYAIRHVKKFQVNHKIDITRTQNSSAVVGIIEPLLGGNNMHAVQLIKGSKFNVFDCKFYKDKQTEIIADGIPYEEYKEVTNFKLYVSSTKKLLIANVSLSVSTPFLKYLMACQPDLVDLKNINFDFRKIVNNNALVDQVWFGTSDIHARTKGFNGKEVNRNKEAMNAISAGQATYLKASIDVTSNNRTVKRIIGFSKKSGLIIVKSNDASIDTYEKELNLLMDAFETYKSFS